MASSALADRIWIGRLAGQEVEIRQLRGDSLIYLVGSRERETPLDELSRIEIDGEDRFNAAEEAYQSGDWERSARQYSDYLSRRGGDEWVRRRATFRLVDAAARANLFREAVDGYVALVDLDAEAAATRQPSPDRAGVTPNQIGDARERVRTGLSAVSGDATKRKMLLSFLLRLDNAAGDADAAANTVQQLVPLVGDTVPENRQDWPTFARVTLSRADLALRGNNPAEASRLIESSGSVFIEPELLAEALFKLAQASEAEAGDDESKLLDAAFAYVQVPAQAPDATAIAASALLAAGDIHRNLGLDEDATKLYSHVATTYAETPAAAEASERLAAE